ncbi:MAG: hypothetical protein HYY98_13185 [Burkholderiales bacterium]|nr:hypothetical protein [Burkholderiales bacterium]
MNPLRAAAALGCALVALAGCGGGSDDTAPPPAPGLAAPTNFTFELNFRWTATPGATRYELHVDPDGPGPLPETKAADGTNDDWRGFRYQPRGSQGFTGTFYDASTDALNLATRINATYRLRACDANGCGTFTAPIVNEPSYEFPSGRVPIFHSQSKDGLTLAIGQPSADADSTVAVFTRSSSAHPWQLHAVLRSGNAQFGVNLALSDDGNTLAIHEPVPAQGDLTPYRTRSYIYQRSGNTWIQQASLEPSNLPAACQPPCAASGNKLALSADGSLLVESINFYSQATRKYMGAVVIYARSGTTWSQQALLETGDKSADIMALARDGKTLAVNQGAQYRSESVPSFALVFTQQSNGIWSQQASIPVGIWYFMDIAAGAYSSMQLSDDGNTLAVLASNGAEDRAIHAADLSCGALSKDGYYMALFTRNGTAWQRQAAISRGYDSASMWALARDGNALLYGNEIFTRSNGAWACP